MKKSKPTIASLKAEIKRLKERIKLLESVPAVGVPMPMFPAITEPATPIWEWRPFSSPNTTPPPPMCKTVATINTIACFEP